MKLIWLVFTLVGFVNCSAFNGPYFWPLPAYPMAYGHNGHFALEQETQQRTNVKHPSEAIEKKSHNRMIQTIDPLTYLQEKLEDLVKLEAREQSTKMAEKYLGSYDVSCIQRSFCEIALIGENNEDLQLYKAAEQSIGLIKNILEELNPEKELDVPNMEGLVAAFEVGKKGQNLEFCRALFQCVEPTFSAESRITCPNTSKMCPAYSITCSLCGMFLPGVCGTVCPVIGIYCGTAGYSCTGNEEEETEVNTMPSRESYAKEFEAYEEQDTFDVTGESKMNENVDFIKDRENIPPISEELGPESL